MTLQLVIAPADIKRLVGIAPADLSQDGVITALLASEQPPAEYALDPGILSRVAAVVPPGAPVGALPVSVDPGALATLTLGVAEQLAGSFLAGLGRFPHFAEPLPLSALVPQAAAALVVAVSDIKRLIGVAASDTSQDSDLAALITAEQLAREYALDPSVLAAAVSAVVPNAGLKALLTLGIAEQIAGSALSEAGRVPGIADDIQISTLHFSTSHGVQPDKLGAELTALGTARLLPYSRHIRAEHVLKPVLNQPDLIKLGDQLTARGLARLEPYLRARRSRAVQAAGPAPDDYADLVQTSVSGVLPGADLPASESVFIGAFSDAGDAFTETLNADGLELDSFENEGGIYWGQP